MTVMQPESWQAARDAHSARTERWVAPRRSRRSRGEQHPVQDFLFEYYPFSVTKLQTWHPGFGVTLAGSDMQLRSFLEHPDYVRVQAGVRANPERLLRHAPRLKLVQRLLRGVGNRPIHTSCFGLHEWAMVYATDERRHGSVALRLDPDEIRQTVDAIGLRCTHIDAYRFFTDEAAPQNEYRPTRQNQPELDQAGCLHVNMDLYKYAMWFRPFMSSERSADAFELAWDARQLDMRAAPYDLAPFGYEPIKLETPAGRQTFVAQQRALAGRAEPIRIALLRDIDALNAALTSAATPCLGSIFQPDPTPA